MCLREPQLPHCSLESDQGSNLQKQMEQTHRDCFGTVFIADPSKGLKLSKQLPND